MTKVQISTVSIWGSVYLVNENRRCEWKRTIHCIGHSCTAILHPPVSFTNQPDEDVALGTALPHKPAMPRATVPHIRCAGRGKRTDPENQRYLLVS